MKTYICLAIVIVANAFGNLLLALGMREVGRIASYSPVDLIVSGLYAALNPWVASGVGLMVVFFAAHALVLTWADLSYVVLTTSIGYALVAFLGWWFLDESVSPMRWLGVATITVGVMLVGSTPTSTMPKDRR